MSIQISISQIVSQPASFAIGIDSWYKHFYTASVVSSTICLIVLFLRTKENERARKLHHVAKYLKEYQQINKN